MALNMAQIRDTKWLTLEVCREFQRGTCSRSDQECKFAHPAKSCQVDNGRVIACFDSLKVRKGRRWTGSLEVRSHATDKRLSTFSLTDTSRKYIWSYKLEMAVVYSLPHARAHHLALTCALSLVPPISGQVTATCDQGHREGWWGWWWSCSFLDSGSRSQALVTVHCGISEDRQCFGCCLLPLFPTGVI